MVYHTPTLEYQSVSGDFHREVLQQLHGYKKGMGPMHLIDHSHVSRRISIGLIYIGLT